MARVARADGLPMRGPWPGAGCGRLRGAGLLLGLAALLAGAAPMEGAAAAEAGAWPAKPLRLIVPNTPGGGADAIARVAASALAERLGQAVVVENRPGANGAVGAEALLRSPSDGYTLMLVFTSMMAISPVVYAKPAYDPVRDFQPIGTVCDMGMVLLASRSVAAGNLEQLLALVRAQPEAVFIASSGNGAFSHLLAEMLNSRAAIHLLHVPYKGEAGAIQDLLADQRPGLYFSTLASALPQVEGGRLKALGVTTGQRLAPLPGVPTFAEQGFPDFNESFWYGLAASASTPGPGLGILEQALAQGMRQPAAGDALRRLGCAPMHLDAQAFAALIRASLAKYGAIARAVGMQVD
jgi:tripartite-type tricarboxylate transporter receptor subunit TctC